MVIYNYSNKSRNTNSFLSIFYYIKIVFDKLFFTFILLLSLFFLIYSKNNKTIDIKIKNHITVVMTPYIGIFKFYNFLTSELINITKYYININNVNNNLKKENLDLMIKLLDLKIIENQNEELKNILNFIYINNITDYTIKKISIISNNSFVNKIKFDLYDNKKIKENDLVIDNNGNLIGKVINISEKSAEILLLSDINFRVPAVLKNSMTKVILSGNENNNMKINYFLDEKINIIEGESVYTHNDNNIVKNNVYIGKIININDKSFVKISGDLSKLNFVIILHGSEGLVK